MFRTNNNRGSKLSSLDTTHLLRVAISKQSDMNMTSPFSPDGSIRVVQRAVPIEWLLPGVTSIAPELEVEAAVELELEATAVRILHLDSLVPHFFFTS